MVVLPGPPSLAYPTRPALPTQGLGPRRKPGTQEATAVVLRGPEASRTLIPTQAQARHPGSAGAARRRRHHTRLVQACPGPVAGRGYPLASAPDPSTFFRGFLGSALPGRRRFFSLVSRCGLRRDMHFAMKPPCDRLTLPYPTLPCNPCLKQLHPDVTYALLP
jgi:hypothetical protein